MFAFSFYSKKTLKISGFFVLLILVFLLFFYGENASADMSLKLDEEDKVYSVYPFIQVFEDQEGLLGFGEILEPEIQGKFHPHEEDRTPSFSYTDSAFWFKLEMTNLVQEARWFLQVEYPLLQEIKFFFPDGEGGYKEQKTGSLVPFNQRPIKNKDFVFPIPDFPRGETITVYLRTQTEFSHIVPMQILERNSFYSRESGEYLANGVYYGMLLIMAFYNLFLFYFSRDIRFVFYIFYIVCIAFFHLSLTGLAFQYLWPDFPVWANRSILFFSFGGTIFLLLFACRVLELKERAPALKKIFLGFVGFSMVMLPASLFFPYSLIMQLMIFTVFTGSIALLWGVIKARQEKVPSAFYLFWAWVFLVGGIILLIGRSFGFLPHNFFTYSGMQLGSALEIIFLSLALVAHTSFLDREKEKALELAQRDDLTNLLNRRALFAIGQKQVEIARLQKSPLSVVMIDIDGFKK